MRTAHRARTMVISLILMVIMSIKLLLSASSVQGISPAMDMTQRLRLVRNSTMVDVKVIMMIYVMMMIPIGLYCF